MLVDFRFDSQVHPKQNSRRNYSIWRFLPLVQGIVIMSSKGLPHAFTERIQLAFFEGDYNNPGPKQDDQRTDENEAQAELRLRPLCQAKLHEARCGQKPPPDPLG